MLTKDAGSLFLAAASLAIAAAVQMEPGWAGSTLGKQVLAANSSARRAQLGLGPASIAGTWSVNYNPGWQTDEYRSLEIDCFGRYTGWWGWSGQLYFGDTQINTKCIYGDQAQAGGIEWVLPGWNSIAKYECGWFDSASGMIYAYHYSKNTEGTTAHGHSNVGYYGRMQGTRTSTKTCPAALKLFLYAPHWEVADTFGFKPDGVDPISGNDWTLALTNPVTTYSGVEVFDLNSGTGLDTDATTSWTLGNHFTECAWVDWKDAATSWRTLMRTTYDHVILVQESTNYLGLYKNLGSPRGFQSTGYVVNENVWNFVCIVVDADAPSSSFYVSVGGGPLTHVGTVNTFAGSGQKANTLGWPGQEPGYIYMFAHWEAGLSVQEMQEAMADAMPPILTLAPALSPTPSPTAAPTASPTASPTTASPTAAPTTAAPTASPTASPTTASPTAAPTTAAPTASPASAALTTVAPPAAVGAVGDPHMSDVRGRTFDMNAVGNVTLLLVPKGATADLNSTLLRVQAGTKRAGVCGSLYIQNLLIHGTWVQHSGGYSISATDKQLAQPTNPRHKWRTTVGPGVRLTVGYGMTESGILYLNFHANGLAKARMPIGGLLGDEENEAYQWAKEKPRDCLSLSAAATGAAGSEGSTASASL